MRVALVALMVVGCASQSTPDDEPDDEPVDLSPIPTVAPCRMFEDLSDRWWMMEPPYMAPTLGVRIVVDSTDFSPLSGEGDPYLDENHRPIGTLVWGPKELVEADGSSRLGAAGRVGSAVEECQWLDASIVLQ